MSTPEVAGPDPPVVAVDRLVASYGDRPVLHGVSTSVAPGEVVAVLGANGSGKSTLVRATLGLLPAVSGSVALFGVPVERLRQWYRVGYVPQRLGAGSGVPATVAEVVRSGRLPRRRLPLPGGAGDRTAVTRAIDTVGLTDLRHDLVTTLSGGQQQRTLIARALATEPELLVLDEPTAGVDADNQAAFARALAAFVAEGGTVLVVAHELGPLAPLVGRAVVLHHGRVVHDGPVPHRAASNGTAPFGDPGGLHPHAPDEPPDMWQSAPPR